MLFLFTSFAGLVLPAGIERVLSASDAYGVLQIERGSSTRVKDIQHAHRSIALKVHPDHHCTTTGPVCDAAHRAMVRVSDARDELMRSVPSVGSHSAQPAANSEDHGHTHALWELAGILAQLIFVAAAFHLIKLFDSATRFLKLCWRGRRLAARLSASRWRRWWSYLSSFVLAAYAPCAHLLVRVPSVAFLVPSVAGVSLSAARTCSITSAFRSGCACGLTVAHARAARGHFLVAARACSVQPLKSRRQPPPPQSRPLPLLRQRQRRPLQPKRPPRLLQRTQRGVLQSRRRKLRRRPLRWQVRRAAQPKQRGTPPWTQRRTLRPQPKPRVLQPPPGLLPTIM